MTELPIKGRRTMLFVFVLATMALMIAASVAGVVCSHAVYPTDDLRKVFVPNDVVNLCIGLPFLLVSLLMVWRNRLIGLLTLFGALLFVLYSYLVYVLAMPLGIPLLLHLALVLLSACALVILVPRIDASSIRERFAGAVLERVAGTVLAGLGILFFFRAFGMLMRGIIHQSPIAKTDLAVDLADLLITPLWIIGGILLIFRNAYGYVAAPALLMQASMLFIALIAYLVLQPFLAGTPSRWIDVVVVFAIGSICFAPLLLFLRRSLSK